MNATLAPRNSEESTLLKVASREVRRSPKIVVLSPRNISVMSQAELNRLLNGIWDTKISGNSTWPRSDVPLI